MTKKSGSDAIATVQKMRPANQGTSTQNSVSAGNTTSAARRSTFTHAASGTGELGSPRRTMVRASDDRLAMNGSDALVVKGGCGGEYHGKSRVHRGKPNNSRVILFLLV